MRGLFRNQVASFLISPDRPVTSRSQAEGHTRLLQMCEGDRTGLLEQLEAESSTTIGRLLVGHANLPFTKVEIQLQRIYSDEARFQGLSQ